MGADSDGEQTVMGAGSDGEQAPEQSHLGGGSTAGRQKPWCARAGCGTLRSLTEGPGETPSTGGRTSVVTSKSGHKVQLSLSWLLSWFSGGRERGSGGRGVSGGKSGRVVSDLP